MFDQLKPLMQNGERYIMVEGGKPEYVLMRFDDYAALARSRKGNPAQASRAPNNPGEWERSNAEFEERQAGEVLHSEFTAEPIGSNPDPTTIRLEDLPL